jgi:hypothetical protein
MLVPSPLLLAYQNRYIARHHPQRHLWSSVHLQVSVKLEGAVSSHIHISQGSFLGMLAFHCLGFQLSYLVGLVVRW